MKPHPVIQRRRRKAEDRHDLTGRDRASRLLLQDRALPAAARKRQMRRAGAARVGVRRAGAG